MKRNKEEEKMIMKRFLTTILTISMCLSIMAVFPVASAADENVTEYSFIPDGTTLKKTTSINPTKTVGDWYTVNTRNWRGFDVSDNIKQFFDESIQTITLNNFGNEITWTRNKVYDWAAAPYDEINGASLRLLQGMPAGLLFSPALSWAETLATTGGGTQKTSAYTGQLGDAWFALKLTAPQTRGKHELTFKPIGTGQAGSCDVFFAPYEEGEDAGSYYMTDKNKVASEIAINPLESPIIEGLTIGEDAQSYILAIRLNGVSGYNRLQLESIKLTKTAESVEVPTEVSYGVFANILACASDVTANGEALGASGIKIGILTSGAPLTVTAKDEVTGYKFRYWVLGGVAGRYYSSEKTVELNPYTNIPLTAIYAEENDSSAIEIDLFNGNGGYLGSIAASELSSGLEAVEPTMTGYQFEKWILSNGTELTKDSVVPESTNAVAQFSAISGYDQPITQAETSENGWLRNGKLVTYSNGYTFYKWLNDAGTIEKNSEAAENKTPLVVFEKFETKFMLEYDKGDCEILEAGILFGKDVVPTLRSATSKARVMYIKEHGQFTAEPMTADETIARGYVVYRDNNSEIKVVYASVD